MFAGVVDALHCSTEIEAAVAIAGASLGPDRRIEFRIGINVGDVVVEDADIFGDGINVASRLEDLGEPGSICVLRECRRMLRAASISPSTRWASRRSST